MAYKNQKKNKKHIAELRKGPNGEARKSRIQTKEANKKSGAYRKISLNHDKIGVVGIIR